MLRPGPPTPPNLQLRIRGAVLGAVLGDAFGAPFEGSPPGEALTRAVHERDGAVRPWSYTGIGEVTIGVAESLVERRGFEPEHVLATLTTRSTRGGRGDPAAHVAPLAALLHTDPAALATAAAALAPASDSTMSMSLAIGALVRGEPASSLAAGTSSFAMSCFLRSPSHHEALMETVAAGGDACATGSLVGALLGAANGAGVFPRQWVHNLENGPRGRDAVIDLADGIWEIATATRT